MKRDLYVQFSLVNFRNDNLDQIIQKVAKNESKNRINENFDKSTKKVNFEQENLNKTELVEALTIAITDADRSRKRYRSYDPRGYRNYSRDNYEYRRDYEENRRYSRDRRNNSRDRSFSRSRDNSYNRNRDFSYDRSGRRNYRVDRNDSRESRERRNSYGRYRDNSREWHRRPSQRDKSPYYESNKYNRDREDKKKIIGNPIEKEKIRTTGNRIASIRSTENTTIVKIKIGDIRIKKTVKKRTKKTTNKSKIRAEFWTLAKLFVHSYFKQYC